MTRRQQRTMIRVALAWFVLGCSAGDEGSPATSGTMDATEVAGGTVATPSAELGGAADSGAMVASSSDAIMLAQRDDYRDIGKHDPDAGEKCDARCAGALAALPNATALRDPNLVTFLLSTGIMTVAQPTARPPAPGEKRAARLSVAAVANSRRIALRDLTGGRAQVVAVLVVGQNSALDARYGLSSAVASGMSERFFIVAHDYDVTDSSEPPDTDPARYSRKVAKWSLYGIRGPRSASPTIEKMPVSGTLRWCRHKHAVTNNTGWAGFTRCDADSRAAAILADREAMAMLTEVVSRDSSVTAGLPKGELGWVHAAVGAWAKVNSVTVKSTPSESSAATRQLVAFARLLDDSLAWFTCGLGCCIADS